MADTTHIDVPGHGGVEQNAWAAALKVEPGEGVALGWLVGFSFFQGIVLASFYVASSALFLSTYGSEAIPWVYIASTFVASGTGALYYRVERCWTPSRLLWLTLFFVFLPIATWPFQTRSLKNVETRKSESGSF